MTETTPTTPDTALSQERADLLETLRAHRWFLISATLGMSDEQARTRSTVSALTLGGLIKHVSATEAQWVDFVERGTESVMFGEPDWEARGAEFVLAEDETLAGALAAYEEVAARTDALVATVDLDRAWPLPEAPWFEPGATRTARRVFTHVVGETAQHAGHADIVREAIDGKLSMG